MNRLRRRRHGDGWSDQVNPVRAVLLTVCSSISAATAGVMLLGVLPRASGEGDVVTAVLAAVLAVFNVGHALHFLREALAEVRGP